MRTQRTDAGAYTYPAQIQSPAAYADNGQGGNANADQWTTIRSPLVLFQSMPNGRGTKRSWNLMQIYPTASHWAEFRYSVTDAINATQTLLIRGVRYQILGAIDMNLEHVVTQVALIEYQAQGST